MRNELESLYEVYVDRLDITNNKKYDDLSEKAENALQELKITMNEKQLKLLDNYIDCNGAFETLYEKEFFALGFSLANQLNKESFEKINKLCDYNNENDE